MEKRAKSIIKIAIGAVILGILYYIIGISEILSNIQKLNIITILAVLLLYVIVRLIDGYNIYILLKNFTEELSYLKTLKNYLYGWSIGMFLPSKIGELSLAVFIKKYMEPAKTVAVQLMDKAITIGVLVLLSLFGIGQFITAKEFTAIILPLASIFIILLAILIILTKFSERVQRQIRTAKEAFLQITMHHKKTVLKNTILTIIKILLTAGMAKIIFLNLNAEVPLIQIITINAITQISGLIPVSISGLGVRQAIGTYLYTLVNVAPHIALTHYTIMIILNYSTAGVMSVKALVRR